MVWTNDYVVGMQVVVKDILAMDPALGRYQLLGEVEPLNAVIGVSRILLVYCRCRCKYSIRRVIIKFISLSISVWRLLENFAATRCPSVLILLNLTTSNFPSPKRGESTLRIFSGSMFSALKFKGSLFMFLLAVFTLKTSYVKSTSYVKHLTSLV